MPKLALSREGLIEWALREFPGQFVLFFGGQVLAHGRSARETHESGFALLCARYRRNQDALRRIIRRYTLLVTKEGVAWPREEMPRFALLPERLRNRKQAKLIRFPADDSPRFAAEDHRTGQVPRRKLRLAG